MMGDSIETQMAVLIQSVSSLSEITCNHDKLLTKLVDDHELRIRGLEKCSLALVKLTEMEQKFERDHITIDQRLRNLENWRWYIAGGIAVITAGGLWLFAHLGG